MEDYDKDGKFVLVPTTYREAEKVRIKDETDWGKYIMPFLVMIGFGFAIGACVYKSRLPNLPTRTREQAALDWAKKLDISPVALSCAPREYQNWWLCTMKRKEGDLVFLVCPGTKAKEGYDPDCYPALERK